MGIILGNIPFKAAGLEIGLYEDNSVLNFFYSGVKDGWYPPLIFLGIGAMTDFSALIANPKLLLIGGAAQFGIFGAYMLALLLGFEPNQAAGIAIIGGADGPTAIFLSSKLSPNLMGGYCRVRILLHGSRACDSAAFDASAHHQKGACHTHEVRASGFTNRKNHFPYCGIAANHFHCSLGTSVARYALLREPFEGKHQDHTPCKTAGSSLNDIVVMLLGLTVGCSTQASVFLTRDTIFIFILGALSFIIASASGICFVKLMNLFLPKGNKINPLIGNAGVSAVPMSARISNQMGLKYDSGNYLLTHAMGPNVAGVIGSAVAAGVLLGFLN